MTSTVPVACALYNSQMERGSIVNKKYLNTVVNTVPFQGAQGHSNVLNLVEGQLV